MDTTYRLKIKIESNEFEAEGPADVVKEQFEAFKELVSAVSEKSTNGTPAATPSSDELKPRGALLADAVLESAPKPLNKIMRVDGRNVSLTARPAGIGEAVLLLLLGQRELRENESVSGAEIVDGIRRTGGFPSDRVDRLLENLARDGQVIVIGERRAKRYRLTNAGYASASGLATELITTVP